MVIPPAFIVADLITMAGGVSADVIGVKVVLQPIEKKEAKLEEGVKDEDKTTAVDDEKDKSAPSDAAAARPETAKDE